MASRQQRFLTEKEREKLTKKVGVGSKRGAKRASTSTGGGTTRNEKKKKTERKTAKSRGKKVVQSVDGEDVSPTPCIVCNKDSDHGNLLICDKCEGYYHTYCLEPPLKSIPKNNWYCDDCKPDQGDGLEQLVSALPPSFTSRFGEICWGQGGPGYGWWPCCIYDPRLTLKATRLQARRQLGKKHLVYFLQCDETPFDLLPENKIMSWEEGLASDCYLGKTAKAAGKTRYRRFREALQAATIEESRPVEQRLDWRHEGHGNPQLLPSPIKLAQTAKAKKEKEKRKRARIASASETDNSRKETQAKRSISFGSESLPSISGASNRTPPQSPRLEAAPNVPAAKGAQEEDDDDDMYCKIYLTHEQEQRGKCIGFIVLPSRVNSTFADARTAIMETLETDKFPAEWRFLHPILGPVSIKLETKTGSMITYLKKGPKGSLIGDGSLDNPAKVTIIADPLSPGGKM